MSTGFFPLLKDSSPLIAPGLLAPDPQLLFPRGKSNQKDAQETTFLENLPSLRGFLVYATTCLSGFSQSLPWADAGPIAGTTPWPFGLLRWVRLREARFFGETTGPPARCGRYCPAMPGRQHPALCEPRRPRRGLSRHVIPDARIKAFPRSPSPAYLP